MSDKRFKVTNTTIKVPRPDPKTKRDTRTAIEKVGHAIQFRDENDRVIILPPGRSRFVMKVDGGLLGLRRGDYCSIEEVGSISEVLKNQELDGKGAKKVARKKAAKKASGRKAKAVEMGQDTHGQIAKKAEQNSEYPGAVNPDGEPNFRVIAGKNKKGGKKRSRKQRNTDELEAQGKLDPSENAL